MKNDKTPFLTPQRQSPIGVLVEMLYSLQVMVKSLWPLFIYLLFRFQEISLFFKVLGLGLFILCSLILGYVKYRNFLFNIDEEHDEFIVQSGFINKKRSVIQLAKIQQVSINQSFIQKLVDVYGIEVETAGSIKNEVTIKAVTKEDALKIKSRLLKSKQQETETAYAPTQTEQPSLLIRISLLNLFKTGVTSNYLESAGLLIAFSITIFDNFKDFGFIPSDAKDLLVANTTATTLLQLAFLSLVTIIVITLLFNIVRTMVVYYDFQISRTTGSLLLSYGLFNNRNTMINPNKVQITRFSSNYFQKKLNILQLSIHQASSDIARDTKAKIHVPGCNKAESDAIIAFIYGQMPEKGIPITPNIRKIINGLTLLIIVPILTFVIASTFHQPLNNYFYFFVPYFALVIPVIYFSYKNNCLFVHENFIIKQSGIWDIKTEIIETHKIQAISTKQNIWHQKAGIGHVTLHTAGGDIQFKFADYTLLNQYVDYWLYRVETSTKDWM